MSPMKNEWADIKNFPLEWRHLCGAFSMFVECLWVQLCNPQKKKSPHFFEGSGENEF